MLSYPYRRVDAVGDEVDTHVHVDHSSMVAPQPDLPAQLHMLLQRHMAADPEFKVCGRTKELPHRLPGKTWCLFVRQTEYLQFCSWLADRALSRDFAAWSDHTLWCCSMCSLCKEASTLT